MHQIGFTLQMIIRCTALWTSDLSKQVYLAGLAKSLANLLRHESEGGGFVSCIVSSFNSASIRADPDSLSLRFVYSL